MTNEELKLFILTNFKLLNEKDRENIRTQNILYI